MIAWREAVPDRAPRELAEWTRTRGLGQALDALWRLADGTRVVLPAEVQGAIRAHLERAPVELGGILLGRPYRLVDAAGCERYLVEIAHAVPSRDFDSTAVSLEMETEIWNRARPLIDAGECVVGWYHSHPDLGAFFSGTDRRTQRAVFSHAYSVGVVFDPVRREEAWYLGPDAVALERGAVGER
jgi:proteasome lid subunit RPN8/RPN11